MAIGPVLARDNRGMAAEQDRSPEDDIERTEGAVIDFGQIEPVRGGGHGPDHPSRHGPTLPPNRPRWTTWLAVGIAAAVAVVVGVRLGTSNHHDRPTALPSPP